MVAISNKSFAVSKQDLVTHGECQNNQLKFNITKLKKYHKVTTYTKNRARLSLTSSSDTLTLLLETGSTRNMSTGQEPVSGSRGPCDASSERVEKGFR